MAEPSTPPSHRSRSTTAAGTLRKAPNEFEFNLGAAKGSVLKALDDKANTHFKKFYNGPLFDRLLNSALLYFTAKFMQDWLIKAMDKARKTHLEGYDPYVVASRLAELEEEVESTRKDLSPAYSEIILKYSKYDKPQHDKQFFEALVTCLVGVLDQAFAKLDKRADIEAEVGHLFRSKHFNINHRRFQPPRSVDTLSVKELYCIKHETTNRALNAKMLSSLHQKPPTLAVQVASVTNSPLITQFVQSPIVARAQAKDPAERHRMFESLVKTDKAGTTTGTTRLSTVVKVSASMHGVDISGLKDNVRAGMTAATKETKDAIGLMPEERAYRSDRRAPPRGVIAPESVGLPADDNFNYLALLKRYVLYGPNLGISPQQQQQPVGPSISSLPTYPSGGSVTQSPSTAAPAGGSTLSGPGAGPGAGSLAGTGRMGFGAAVAAAMG